MKDIEKHNILFKICDEMRDFEMQTGIKLTDKYYIVKIKNAGIYDWYLREKLIEQREKKLVRILK